MRTLSISCRSTEAALARTIFAGITFLLLIGGECHVASAQNQSAELAGLTPTDATTLEAVDSSGNQTYVAGSPIIYEGILLNTPSQMSTPTADFNDENEGGPNGSDIGNPNPYWQIFVQSNQPGDFGGVAAYMGQNYGNIPDSGGGGGATFPGGVFTPDTANDYSDSAWNSQVLRLNSYNNDQNTVAGPLAPGQQLQAGDEVIIYARGGLSFGGKYDINEEHTITPDYASNPGLSFDIFYAGHPGLPTPISLQLSDLYSGSSIFFDPTRATGAEHYQGDWVTLDSVRVTDPTDWVSNGTVTVEDASGRTFAMQLGTGAFGSAPTGYFNATGIFDQESGQGSPTGGYELWVMDPSNIVATPEPSSLVLAAIAMGGLVGWQLRRLRLGSA